MDNFIPVVALRGMVVFPDCITTVDVGRALSIKAIEHAYENGSEILCLTQMDVSETAVNPDGVYKIGTVVQIRQLLKPSDANMRVLISGKLRAKAVDLHVGEDYLECKYEVIDDKVKDTIRCEALNRRIVEYIAELHSSTNKVSKELMLEIAALKDGSYSRLANIVSNSLIAHDEKKQLLLEIPDVDERLEELVKNLGTEIEIAKMDKRIANRVKRQIDKGQKEYYLKEQIKAIGVELGEGEDERDELDNKIKQAKMPKEVEAKALKEINKLSKMSPTSPDAAVIRGYVEWLTDLQWNTETKDNKDMDKAKKILDEDHFGLNKIKERILEYLAVMQLTGSLKGPILCFVGPPGVGKTSIVKSIARALDRKYVRMSLGGVRDEAEIRGHRRTYIGAIPGKIIYMLKQAQSINPVILFDEIDKMSSDFRGDPASAMLEVLDPEQNFSFVDHYLEVPFNLSKVLFVATANSVESIPPALLDRMEIIDLTGYTEEEKLEIANSFLIPKLKTSHGLKEDAFKISNNTIRAIIKGYTRESGVRTLERELAAVCRKVALKQVSQEKVDDISVEDLDFYLGIPRFKTDIVDLEDEIGSATGLAWTMVGGTTLTIDVTLFKGKGEVLLTGKLGEVMKESARAALSLVKARAQEYGINESIFAETDIHIHIPEGAIPKDGPSAGITMATAILSAFSHKKVSKKVAMTGEVTLRGKVLPIGGLKEKALAAYRVGIYKIIVPSENKKDICEIPKEVRDNLNIIYASDISNVFENALVD